MYLLIEIAQLGVCHPSDMQQLVNNYSGCIHTPVARDTFEAKNQRTGVETPWDPEIYDPQYVQQDLRYFRKHLEAKCA